MQKDTVKAVTPTQCVTLRSHRGLRVTLMVLAGVLAALCLLLLVTNLLVCSQGKSRIRTPEQLAEEEYRADVILVLGAGLRPDGMPSDMLSDRVRTAVGVYEKGISGLLLMSGDRSSDTYDEPRAMAAYAGTLAVFADGGIDTDGEGYSTYESLANVKARFGEGTRVVIVTQSYHLYRALDIAKVLGLDAVGVSADLRSYRGQFVREVREMLARTKDFLFARFRG